jgi:D-serine deaminase-like pyridoxal phosphate-dependent protein
MSVVAVLARLERATAELEAPFALVDLDAFWANAAEMQRRAAGKPIRLASKSLRCRALQERVLALPGFQGTLAFTLPEALWLAGHGARNILVAYPSVDRHALRGLVALSAEDPASTVTLMVDCREQLDLIAAAIAEVGGESAQGTGSAQGGSPAQGGASTRALVRVCLELDAGFRPLGGRVRIGAKRSPLHTPEQAAAFAREIVARPGLRLVGLMAYESQIAGLGDAPPGRPARALALRLLQSASGRELAKRRAAAIEAVRAVAPLEFVNGGGTGSLGRTTREPAVTELAAGSGLYGPTLFDAYRVFRPRPAAMFALPVVRRPGSGVVTLLGGGYLASGPAERSRLPRPYLPPGLRLDSQEGAGEVQTPVLGAPADGLAIGDRVYFRHAKAGELCERFDRLYLVEGERIVEEVPTYRGEGQCFL